LSPTTAVTFASPTAPAGYAWEATSEAVAARYGIPLERIARFDLNTSPAPPELAERLLAAGRLDLPMSEYAPSDYRRLIEAAATRYGVGTDELLVGAGADEILDLIVKAFLPVGGAAVLPAPSYAMYRVLTEQRGARLVVVPRLPASDGFALDGPSVQGTARAAQLVWLCSPNNPTGRAEPDGTIETLLDGLAADATSDGRPLPIVVLDEAYAEFAGTSLLELRNRYDGLVIVRTISKAFALAGLRVGFAVARPALIAALAPYRPPGSVSVVSVSIAADVLAEPSLPARNVVRVQAERERLASRLRDAGWAVLPSVTNFLLVDFVRPERAADVAEGMLQRGLVPRTFPSDHPLAAYLRLTVRDEEQDDRLIEAAKASRPGGRSAASASRPG
jgi:histidinol-phosphate aminotransferase